MQINKSLKVLFVLNSIFVFAASLFGPLYAIYIQTIDNKIISVSLSWSVFMLSSTLFTYFVSRNGDKIKNQKYLLAFGFLIRSIGWLCYLFVSSLPGIIVVQIILGFGDALGTPSWGAIFAKHLDGKREIMDYSDWDIVSNLTVALATITGGVLVTYFGFNFLFILMGVLASISFVGTMLVPRDLL